VQSEGLDASAGLAVGISFARRHVRRREHARQGRQRVEVRHERSGNAMLAGRELDPVTALAAKANIDALAVELRNAGWEGSLQHLRAWIMTELLQGRNPLDHLNATRDPEPASLKPERPANPVGCSSSGGTSNLGLCLISG